MSLLQPVRGRDTEPSRQPLDVLDAIGLDRRWPLRLSLGRVAGSVPGVPALTAQGAERLPEQGPFIVTQAVYGLRFDQDAVLRID